MATDRFLQTEPALPPEFYATINNSSQCYQCMSQSGFVCRSETKDSDSICCDLSSPQLSFAKPENIKQVAGSDVCQRTTFCSGQIWVQNIDLFACPYEFQKCGMPRGNIEIDLNVKQTISIQSTFDSNSICWYQLSTRKRTTDNTDLFMNLYFTSFSNVNIYVSSAPSLNKITSFKQINQAGIDKNFTQQANNFYVLVLPIQTEKQFSAKFEFSYYQKFWDFQFASQNSAMIDAQSKQSQVVNETALIYKNVNQTIEKKLFGWNNQTQNISLTDGWRYFQNLTLAQYKIQLNQYLKNIKNQKFVESLLEKKNGNLPKKQRGQVLLMMGILICVAIEIFWQYRSSQKVVIQARQKIQRSPYSIYINNYDDVEFNEKVKKVQDADRNQLNLNDENDLAQLRSKRRRNKGYSPINNPNFARRQSGNFEDMAGHGLTFSENAGENQTQSLNDTQYVEDLDESDGDDANFQDQNYFNEQFHPQTKFPIPTPGGKTQHSECLTINNSVSPGKASGAVPEPAESSALDTSNSAANLVKNKTSQNFYKVINNLVYFDKKGQKPPHKQKTTNLSKSKLHPAPIKNQPQRPQSAMNEGVNQDFENENISLNNTIRNLQENQQLHYYNSKVHSKNQKSESHQSNMSRLQSQTIEIKDLIGDLKSERSEQSQLISFHSKPKEEDLVQVKKQSNTKEKSFLGLIFNAQTQQQVSKNANNINNTQNSAMDLLPQTEMNSKEIFKDQMLNLKIENRPKKKKKHVRSKK